MSKCSIAISSIVSLVSGAMIYVTCRQDVIFLSPLRSQPWFDKIKIYSGSNSPMIEMMIYNLPDALWYYSMLSVMILLYDKTMFSIVLVVVAMAFPFVLEIMQAQGVISGTFDWYDILIYLITLIITLCLLKKHFYKAQCS